MALVKLFAYGTLARKHRLEALLGRKVEEAVPALLPGYRMYPTPRGYPIVLASPGDQVEGVAWEVKEEELGYVDHYEGLDESPPFYRRIIATVRLPGGEEAEAFVYEGNPDIYWDIEEEPGD